MWNDTSPIRIDWPAKQLKPLQVLYELDSPALFTCEVGLAEYVFFKKDETDEGDLFLACTAEKQEIEALLEGRLSIRGVLNRKEGWLVETDFELNVIRFQEQDQSHYEDLLPNPGIALRASFGIVPDSLVQAKAFMAFKFFSQAMTTQSMPLSVLVDTFDGVSKFVKGVLTPIALLGGRDNRFFDVRVGEPVFSSLLIAIEAPEIDSAGLLTSKRTVDLRASELRQASLERGSETWEVIKSAVKAFSPESRDHFQASDYREFFDNIVDLVPSDTNEFEKLEITLNRGNTTEFISINKEIGQRFIQERESLNGQILSVEGVITEVNGEANTFLLRDNSYGVTTCDPSGNLFQQLDDDGLMSRGQRLRVTGKYWRRPRRGLLSFDTYPDIL